MDTELLICESALMSTGPISTRLFIAGCSKPFQSSYDAKEVRARKKKELGDGTCA